MIELDIKSSENNGSKNNALKKVISFCLYGSKATYIVGMKENISLAKKFFPDWVVTIYYNDTVPEKYIKEYKELGANCVLCENIGVNKMNWEGMFWRWLPLDDPDVGMWLSRDADSRLSEREAKLIQDWETSGKTLHCIRDHRCHMHCIMGGLFGINNSLFHQRYKFKKVKTIIKDSHRFYRERPYNVDQIFLNDHIWKLLKNDVMAHISNQGRKVYDTDILIPSVPDFIGKQYRLNDGLVKERANIDVVIPEKNVFFKIKSAINNSCLELVDNKVKFRPMSGVLVDHKQNSMQSMKKDPQLWKLDQDSRIINVSTNKYLDFDGNSERDLVVSSNKFMNWNFLQGGFIVNKQNNLAIDVKGGLTDTRKQLWLYKLNYSDAQQWDFKMVDMSNIDVIIPRNGDLFKIKCLKANECLDLNGDKVRINPVNSSNSQVWKLDEAGRIINVSTGKYLDFQRTGERDLLVSDNKTNTWEFKKEGFVVNRQNNMVIDFKGGIKDSRKQAWLIKLNNTVAQKWNFLPVGIEDENELMVQKEDQVESKNGEKTRSSIPVNCLSRVEKPRVDEYFDQIYVIHVDCLIERKKLILKHFHKHNLRNITIIDSINKYEIDEERLKSNGIIGYEGNSFCKDKSNECWCNGNGHGGLHTGMYAVTFGHYLVWIDILKNNYKRCLILEDDAIFTEDLHNYFETLRPNIPVDWELLYFSNSRFLRKAKTRKHPTFGTSIEDYNDHFYWTPYGYIDASCYAVTNSTAKIYCDNFYPIRANSDGYIGLCIDRLNKIKRAYICKKDLSFNGSMFLRYGDKVDSVLNEKYDDKGFDLSEKEDLNRQLRQLATKYEKTDIEMIYTKNMAKSMGVDTTVNMPGNIRIDQYFDQIYFIHLDCLNDRKKSIINQIRKYGLKNVTIIDTINKYDIDMERLKQTDIVGYKGNSFCKDKSNKCWCNGGGHDEDRHPGRVACMFGHYLVWKDIMKNNYNNCLILEDDAIFSEDLHKRFQSIYPDIPKDWELIYYCDSRWIGRTINEKHPVFGTIGIDYNDNFCWTPFGQKDAGCYAVTNSTAKIMVDNFYPIRAAADGYIGVCIDRLNLIKKAYICKQDFSFNGTLGASLTANCYTPFVGTYEAFKTTLECDINTDVEKDKREKLNQELKQLVNKYDKTDIEHIYIKCLSKDIVPVVCQPVVPEPVVPVLKSKKVLILNHNYHHKNKRGLEMICEYLNYELIYGGVNDIPAADVVYCPSRPFDVRKYPDKRFVFGPHLSIFPDGKLGQIHNQNNSVYIQPSPWARDVWTNWKSMDAEKLIPIKSFAFPVEVDLFKPSQGIEKENVFIMFKHRKPEELRTIENYLRDKKINFRTFRYGGYKQDDYIKYLQTCKYGIWIGRHESQGFALQEALSCDIPLLVWNVTNMQQQHGWRGCPDVYGITIPYWDKCCGEYFYKQEEFAKTYETFLRNLDKYTPREFVVKNLTVKQCADRFHKVFLGMDNVVDKVDFSCNKYKVLTSSNSLYFDPLKKFIDKYNEERLNFDDLLVYDIGLTSDQENELYILQAKYGFYIYKLDFSKYPEHVNLNIEKWSGLHNSYAFKPVIIYETLQKNLQNNLQNKNSPLIYIDCGIGFSNNTFKSILENVQKKQIWLSISADKGRVESMELNHPEMLKHFNIDRNDIITCTAGIMGINYSDPYCKKIIDEWYQSSLIENVIIPKGSSRNNHRQDQSVLSCVLHNNKYDYDHCSPVKYKYTTSKNPYSTEYNTYKCASKKLWSYESIVYTNTLEEAIEIYLNRKQITKEEFFKDYFIHSFDKTGKRI